MEKLTNLARNFIATLRQASDAVMLSHLCGLRNLDDKLALQVSSSENELAVITAPHQEIEPVEDRAMCKECGQKSKPTGSVVFVLGAPGTGKGTQCAFLAQEFGFHHLSYGDLCRRLRKDQDPIVSRLNTKNGSNNPDVPDDLGAWLMWREIRKEPGRRWLLDGFPKRVGHLEEFLNLMPTPSLTLIFKCPEEISQQRVAKRGKAAGEQARPEDLNENVSWKRIKDFHRNMAQSYGLFWREARQPSGGNVAHLSDALVVCDFEVPTASETAAKVMTICEADSFWSLYDKFSLMFIPQGFLLGVSVM